MKKKLFSQLWIYFASIVFISILVTLLCFLGFIFLLSRHSISPAESAGKPTLYPLFVFAGFSMVVGTGIFISDYRKYHAAFTINREHLKIEQTGKPAYPTGKERVSIR